MIVQFMAACCGKSKRTDDDAEDVARQTRICPPNEVQLERLHRIMDEIGEKATGQQALPKRRAKAGAKAAAGEDSDDEAIAKRSEQMQNALHTTDKLWRRDKSTWQIDDLAIHNRGNTRLSSHQGKETKSKKAKRKKQEDPNVTQARAYVNLQQTNIDAWWQKQESSAKPPTSEQRKFIQSVIQRCLVEQKELHSWTGSWSGPASQKKDGLSESKRMALLGIPGAGKSHCIHLLRDFFTNCMNWTDGVQFQFLATQNTMAELIGGKTVNTWGVIPPNKAAAMSKVHGSKDVDWDKLFENALSMRWLIIDECSTLSPYLLSTLESFLRSKACVRHPYCYRNAKRQKDPRPFGGINMIFSGDLWQLPPVQETAIFANPTKKSDGENYEAGEQRIFSMFWDACKDPKDKGYSKDAIQELHELTICQRNDGDAWLQEVLQANRYGNETWEMYCFQHGLPTRNPGSWLPSSGLQCGDPSCKILKEQWDMLWRRNAMPWIERKQMECSQCQRERARRCRIISQREDDSHMHGIFVDAPYVHPFRAPANHAQRLRALHFARSHKSRVLWVVAHDELTTKDAKTTAASKAKWLEFDDKTTAGIPGMLPLILDLPIRFTMEPDANDRLKGIFTNARGWLRGWELPEQEEERLKNETSAELVLYRRPTYLYIETRSQNEALDLIDGKRIYRLRCHCKPWSAYGQVPVKRFGFPIVPDFGGTAHAYCGTSLEACIGDLLDWAQKPYKEAAVRGYIIKSRIRRAENLLLANPYSPWLFRLGAPPGPNYLLRAMRGESRKELMKLWKAEEKQAEEDKAAEMAKTHHTEFKWPRAMKLSP